MALALDEFSDLPLTEFVARNALGDNLCVFVHIPKTAGSSYSTELRTQRRPYHNLHVEYSKEDGSTLGPITDVLTNFVTSGEVATARSCSGHFTWRQAKTIRDARPDARFIAFLRNPIKRVISDFRYARTPTHPSSRKFIERFPTIESYIDARESQNKMSRFMLPSQQMDRDQIEEHLRSQFLFIGTLEAYPMSFNIISRLLGGDSLPVEHKRKTVATEDNTVTETAALRRMIVDHNKTDRLLYDVVRTMLIARRDEWRALPRASRHRDAA